MKKEPLNRIEDLISLLSSSDDLARTGACGSLIAIGTEAVPFLVQALKHPDYTVRWEAAKALDEIGDPTAGPALVEALNDDAFEVRWRAAMGLGKMGIDGLRLLLKALIENSESAAIREVAHPILHRLAKGELRNDLLPILGALEGRWPSVEVAAVASQVLDRLEKFQELRGEMESAALGESVETVTIQPVDLRARRRARRYAKILQYRALCSEDRRPSKSSPSEGSVLCTMYD